MFLDAAVDREIERIRALLPPIPGRKWAVARAAEGLRTLPEAAQSIDAMARIRGIAVIPAVGEGLIARGARADRLRGATADIAGRLRAITAGKSDEEEKPNEVG
jgi:hypothetical protein